MSRGRAIQKRSKGVSPRPGFALTGRDFAGAALSGVVGFASGLAGGLAGRRISLDKVASPGGAAEPAGLAAGASCPAAGGGGFAAGGIGRPLPAVPACGQERATDVAPSGGRGGGHFSAPGPYAAAQLKPGAVRAFLRARYGGLKPQFAAAAETGVPADTIRKAMATGGTAELSGPHLMRLVAVFGPAFVAAVMEPPPAWARAGGEA
jgi:hypothetical protein